MVLANLGSIQPAIKTAMQASANCYRPIRIKIVHFIFQGTEINIPLYELVY